MLDDSALDDLLRPYAEATRWVVAFSGGLDSTALLHLLYEWRERHDAAPQLCALHVNHKLQAAADAWQQQCRLLCDSLGIPFEAISLPSPTGGEASARAARYAAFETYLQHGDVLMLGHHLDDQVETFFLRLMRGAGLEGLAAMPAERALGCARLARPLLQWSRAELAILVRERGLPYVDDPSNTDAQIDRNYLRHKVLPILAERWPAYRNTVGRATQHLAQAAASLPHSQTATIYTVTGEPGVVLAALLVGDLQSAARTLRSWLRERACQMPDEAVLHEFLRQLRSSGEGSAPRMHTGSYVLARFGDGVYLMPPLDSAPPTESVPIQPGDMLVVPGVGRIGLHTVLCRDEPGDIPISPDQPLHIRWRSGGERIRLAAGGSSRSLKNLLQEVQVPPWWRDRVPLLYSGDDLVAVGDMVHCDMPYGNVSATGEVHRLRLTWQR